MITASSVSSVVQFITVFILFVFVLILTYITTHWIAKIQKTQIHSNNIKIIETYRVAPNKYIQIVQTGKVFLVLAVCKDNITMLTQLDEEQLNTIEDTSNLNNFESFRTILEKIKVRK